MTIAMPGALVVLLLTYFPAAHSDPNTPEGIPSAAAFVVPGDPQHDPVLVCKTSAPIIAAQIMSKHPGSRVVPVCLGVNPPEGAPVAVPPSGHFETAPQGKFDPASVAGSWDMGHH